MRDHRKDISAGTDCANCSASGVPALNGSGDL